MNNQLSRTEMLIGERGIEELSKSHIAIFGIGGVGGYVVEAFARSGVGALDLIDSDKFSVSNLNRQIYATLNTIDKYKTECAKDRILSINPNCDVKTYNTFITRENINDFDFSCYDYVIDAIDTVSAKIELVQKCNEVNTPIISSMGAGNKMHPELFEIADIYKTSVCPLAKVMRQELKKRRIKHLKVVYSKEQPIVNKKEKTENGKRIPGSIAFVPSAVGMIIAGAVIRDLISN